MLELAVADKIMSQKFGEYWEQSSHGEKIALMRAVLMDFLPGAMAAITTAVKEGPKIWNTVKGIFGHIKDKFQEHKRNNTSQMMIPNAVS